MRAFDSIKKKDEGNQWANVAECGQGRRGRQEIIMGILQMARYGSVKTRLMSKVNLSTVQCNKYLGELIVADCIVEESSVFKSTKKGLQVVGACTVCHGLMSLK
jgi:predicted transcriptional regulator